MSALPWREAVGGAEDGVKMLPKVYDMTPLTTVNGEVYHLMRWHGQDRYVIESVAYAMAPCWPPPHGDESE